MSLFKNEQEHILDNFGDIWVRLVPLEQNVRDKQVPRDYWNLTQHHGKDNSGKKIEIEIKMLIEKSSEIWVGVDDGVHSIINNYFK